MDTPEESSGSQDHTTAVCNGCQVTVPQTWDLTDTHVMKRGIWLKSWPRRLLQNFHRRQLDMKSQTGDKMGLVLGLILSSVWPLFLDQDEFNCLLNTIHTKQT